ncbi:unnamed protein product [Protopolystoma xenopodis]|uniref:Uncharacterized protein n=1 Tax=Protopolystoma xenopodis TaxID=117903 RepID=A0A3S5FG42_9PLAT|nr:unnamed protein product [Protopolystoma xenopodis]
MMDEEIRRSVPPEDDGGFLLTSCRLVSLNFVVTMVPRSDDVRYMTDENLASFHRNRRRLPRKQRQYESSNKANRQLVKRNRPSSSGETDLRISSPNTFTRNGSKLNRSILLKQE